MASIDRINIILPPEFAAMADRIAAKGYGSRSAAIRVAIQELAERLGVDATPRQAAKKRSKAP